MAELRVTTGKFRRKTDFHINPERSFRSSHFSQIKIHKLLYNKFKMNSRCQPFPGETNCQLKFPSE